MADTRAMNRPAPSTQVLVRGSARAKEMLRTTVLTVSTIDALRSACALS